MSTTSRGWPLIPDALQDPRTVVNEALEAADADLTAVAASVTAGSGDMTKAIYDSNDSGVVDEAESVAWSGVSGKPTAYPPIAHTHPFGDLSAKPTTLAGYGITDGGGSGNAMTPYVGDGSDGDVTISGALTLSRDMFYNNATFGSGAICNTNGFRIHCKGALTTAAGSLIHNNGNNNTGVTGVSGTNDGTTSGGSGGGVGSLTGSGIGGTGGTQAAIAAASGTFKTMPQAALGLLFTKNNVGQLNSGTGGGGGKGDGTNAGGGGGSGAGIVIINAKSIVHGGAVEAKGGNGFTPIIGNCGGGGGGGAGRIFCNSETFSGSGTFDVSGGVGGGGNGTGNAGNSGAVGTIQQRTW